MSRIVTTRVAILGAALLAVVVPAADSHATVEAQDIVEEINCLKANDDLQINSAGHVSGSRTLENCVSLAHPTVVSATATITGTAEESADGRIIRTQEIHPTVWKDALGATVMTTKELVSRNTVVEGGVGVTGCTGVVVEGPLEGAIANAGVGTVSEGTSAAAGAAFQNRSFGYAYPSYSYNDFQSF